MTDEQKIAQVTAKLTGVLHVGARVRTPSGKLGTIKSIRDSSRAWKWVWVVYASGGTWEHCSLDLELA